MAYSALKREGEIIRLQQLARNEHTEQAPFGPSNRDALADNDDKGKDLNRGLIGSVTDRRTRATLLGQNLFTPGRPYFLVD